MDDPFALFQAEIEALTKKTSENTAENGNGESKLEEEKEATRPKKKLKPTTVVVAAKPQIIAAPPKVTQNSGSTVVPTTNHSTAPTTQPLYQNITPSSNPPTVPATSQFNGPFGSHPHGAQAFGVQPQQAYWGGQSEKQAAKKKAVVRAAGGEVWADPTLADWPDNDFRLFCGDLGNDVSDELLAHAFSKYPSFQRSRVIRDKHTHKSKGYGFVSFADPFDCAQALREMNGRYIGNRPVKLRKSKWKDRNVEVAMAKAAKKKNKKHLFGL